MQDVLVEFFEKRLFTSRLAFDIYGNDDICKFSQCLHAKSGIRLVAKAILEELGYNVLGAVNGQERLQVYLQEKALSI